MAQVQLGALSGSRKAVLVVLEPEALHQLVLGCSVLPALLGLALLLWRARWDQLALQQPSSLNCQGRV